jgi:outer membrane immunogenic protein
MAVRSILLRSVCGATLLAAATAGAQASDPFDYQFTPVSPLIYDWSGAYAGAAVGGMWSDFNTVYAPTGPFSFSAQGFSFSGLGGVLAQFNSFVFGVELDLNLTTLDDTRVVAGIPVTAEADWTGSLRGRAGYAFDRYLIYGTGGLAAGRLSLSTPGGSTSSTEIGWTLGAGVEMGLTENFTARAEYLYSDFGTARGTLAGSPFSTEFDAHTVRAGVTYRFR